jgi:TPP-dependent pyruvate/acetoin dehydrogenase alpha subunit
MSIHDVSELLDLYERMTTIKVCDERFRSMLSTGQIACMYYSPRGQEAVAAGAAVAVHPDDYFITTYRGLHDIIAKGVPLRDVWTEFLGRAPGPCGGKGGPMHLSHPGSGLMLATGIVGGGIPIANGLALASVLQDDGKVTVVHFGDGATNIGAFHEAVNLAAVWRLPVIFVCQNNGYGEKTPFAQSSSMRSVASRADSYGIPGIAVDGNDPIAVKEVVSAAAQRARAGDGPTLVDAETYRFFGHYFGDDMKYMPADERAAAMAADPVPRFRASLIADGRITGAELDECDERVVAAVDDAVGFALEAPFPDLSTLETDVYVETMA